MDLQAWTPRLLVETPLDIGGTVITAQYWNGLWKLHQEQGDDTSTTLKAVIDELYDTVLHPTEAATYVTNPALYEGGPVNVAAQLTEIQEAADARDALIAGKRDSATALDHNDITDIIGTDAEDCHPMSAITGLVDALAAIVAGAASAFNHNDVSARNANDAHPITSITGLESLLEDLQQATNILYEPDVSVAEKLVSLEQAINAITGGAVALTHNAILSRNVADAHPMSSITGLVTALSDEQTARINADTNITNNLLPLKQNKITASTSAPSGGADGDVWIRYG